MKIVKHFLMATLTLCSLSCAAEVLPQPQTTGGLPLMDVMSARKSSRDIDPSQGITRQDLSNMLWAAWGETHDGKRTIATAMNRQELVLYVVTATEVSRYDADHNALTAIGKGDFREATGKQDFAKTAPVNIVLAVDTDKQPRAEFQAYTAGAASQNIYLYCAHAGLKTVVRAMFDDDALRQALQMPANEKILFVQTIGR